MTWLRRWNPLIDWVQQVMYIRTQHGWDTHPRYYFWTSEHRIGTVKLLSDEDLASLESAPDIEILRTPQFWTYAAGASSWTNVPNEGARVEDTQNFYSSRLIRSKFFSNSSSPAPKRTVHYTRVAGTVQHKMSSKLAGQRQLLSPKQMQKLVKKGEACYLAIVLPNKTAVVGAAQGSPDLEHQGMTQKVKRALMKERGAIRKPPPVKETRKKIYSEVPREVRDGLDTILSAFEDMFPLVKNGPFYPGFTPG